jgi:glycosyltransferase involved in cell wall biosynthesis
MRILQLVNTLGFGGAERMAVNLSLNLQAKGHTVHIVSLRELESLPVPEREFRDSGIVIVELKKQDGFSFSTAKALRQYIDEHCIDVIHTHNPLVNHYGVLAALSSRRPTLVNTVHGISTLRMPLWAKILFSSSCLFTDKVACVCGAVQDAVFERVMFTRNRTMIVPNGIKLDPYLAVNRPARRNGLTFGTVGRLVAVKDHRTLLTAFAQVRRGNATVRLEILGDGELRGELQQLARQLGVEDVVHFHRERPDVAGFLSRLDVFVLPSLSEGLPLSLLEAMAASLPIVATRVGGIPEIVTSAQCGWLCQPSDPDDLAAAMLDAAKAPNRADFGERARAAAIALYGDRTMADRYAGLFSSLVARRSLASRQIPKSVKAIHAVVQLKDAVRSLPFGLSLARFYGRCRDWAFDLRHGVDTRGVSAVTSFSVTGHHLEEANAYEPIHLGELEIILSDLSIPFPQFTFVDYGSGKGRALLAASSFPFRTIIGVEFARELHETALQNIRRYRPSSQLCVVPTSIHADAAEYELPHHPLILFFFNPFKASLMELVVQKITQSLADSPREVFIIAYGAWTPRSIIERIPGIRLTRKESFYSLYHISAPCADTK